MVKLSKAICSHLWQVETTMHYILAFGGSIETLGLCCRCFRSRRLSCFTDPEKFLSKAKKDVNIKRDAVCGIYREKTVNGIIGLWGHHSSQASSPHLEIARFHMVIPWFVVGKCDTQSNIQRLKLFAHGPAWSLSGDHYPRKCQTLLEHRWGPNQCSKWAAAFSRHRVSSRTTPTNIYSY